MASDDNFILFAANTLIGPLISFFRLTSRVPDQGTYLFLLATYLNTIYASLREKKEDVFIHDLFYVKLLPHRPICILSQLFQLGKQFIDEVDMKKMTDFSLDAVRGFLHKLAEDFTRTHLGDFAAHACEGFGPDELYRDSRAELFPITRDEAWSRAVAPQ